MGARGVRRRVSGTGNDEEVLIPEVVGREPPPEEMVMLGMNREGLDEEAVDVSSVDPYGGRSVVSEDCDNTLWASKQISGATLIIEDRTHQTAQQRRRIKQALGRISRAGEAVIN